MTELLLLLLLVAAVTFGAIYLLVGAAIYLVVAVIVFVVNFARGYRQGRQEIR